MAMHWNVCGLLLVCLLQSACASVPDLVYGTSPDAVKLGNAGTELFIIDAMEDGQLSCAGDGGPRPCRDRLDRMQQWLSEESPTAPIVVFVHGWHHNGDSDDTNLTGFRDFLIELENLRRQQGEVDPSVDGVYVAWRGDSMKILGPDWIQILDLLTVWSRKDASVRVGEKSMRAIVDMLRTNYPRRAVMVTGLSFGSSVIFHGAKHTLGEESLPGYEFILMNPAMSDTEFNAVADKVRVRERARVVAYGQTSLLRNDDRRQIAVLQSLGDRAVGIGYRFAFPGKPIGFSTDWITHSGFVCSGNCPPANVWDGTECYRRLPQRAEPALVIEAKEMGPGCMKYMQDPVWVAAVSKAVSKDHNDIFGDVQAKALAEHLVWAIKQAEQRLSIE